MTLELNTVIVTCVTIVLTGFAKYFFDLLAQDANIRRKILIEKCTDSIIEMYQKLQDLRKEISCDNILYQPAGVDVNVLRKNVAESYNSSRLFYEKHKIIFSLN